MSLYALGRWIWYRPLHASAEDQHIRALGNWQTSRLRLAASLGRLGLQMI
ncbi:hypothetical protein KIP76_29225 [Pseudomonas aeruginosa]|nr:hypothetical protein [Pseudomonas aeruginosa]MBT9111994.1 hypothetical protein [Pseudomonas aeruginosa]